MLGHFYAQYIAEVQPAKAAIFEVVWETEDTVPMYLIQIPGASKEESFNALPIPYIGSIMYTNSPTGTIVGIEEATQEWTDEMYQDFIDILPFAHYSFRIMAGLGVVFIMLAFAGIYFYRKDKYLDSKLINRAFILAVPGPWLAILFGWAVAEVGRQPWIVNGLMLTKDAVSTNVPAAQVAFSLVTLVIFYAVLFVVEFYLVLKFVKKGPIDDPFRNRG